MKIIRKIFNDFEVVEAPTVKQIRNYCNGNFTKGIKLLIAIYGRCCVICGSISPNFRTDSGVADHYYEKHREDTIRFVSENLLTKTEEELVRMILQ